MKPKPFIWFESDHHSYSLDRITHKGGFNCAVYEDERGGWMGSVNRWSWFKLDYVSYMKSAFPTVEDTCSWCEWVGTSRLFALTTFLRCLIPRRFWKYQSRVVSFTPESYWNLPEKWIFEYK